MAEKSDVPFSSADTKLILAIMQGLKGPPDVDWDIVAAKGNYANPNSAKRSWNMLKAKKGIGGASKSFPTNGGGTATPSPRKRKPDDTNREGGVSSSPTAAKKARKNVAKAGMKEAKREEGSDASAKQVKREEEGEKTA